MIHSESSVPEEVSSVKYPKVPKSVWLILFVKFLERICATGISAVLILYLYTQLGFDQNTSTSIFHINELFTVFFPLIGAILADSYFGSFKTITVICFITSIGGFAVAVAALLSVNVGTISISLIGLIIEFAGLGIIRSNLITFGADQYKMPEQEEDQRFYFAFQMIIVKVGSLLGRIVTPILREDVKCFGRDSCYFLAFVVPAFTMLLGFIIMLCGRRIFTHIKPSGNIFVKMCHSIIYALTQKFKNRKSEEKKNHWLNYAEDKFGKDHIYSTKIVVRVVVILLPTSIYWALFVQQGSRWIFQATQMNGKIGDFTIKPDQMIAANSIFSIILMPICNFILFPLLDKIGLKSLLQRVTIGGFLASISFILSAFVEYQIQKNYISMLWLLPQFAVMALSEYFVYIAIVNFGYSETPEGMKSVMVAFSFLIVALGNLFISLISGLHLFNSQVIEFLFFAGLLFIDMIIFVFLSIQYKYAKERLECEMRCNN